jgi:hypothetical protein
MVVHFVVHLMALKVVLQGVQKEVHSVVLREVPLAFHD